jgi:CheY-like chemotaxis protein
VFHGEITPQVPSLRRYADCLTGSAEAGDALVTSVLRGILSGELELPRIAGARLGLLRALHDVWRPGDAVPGPAAPGDADRPRASHLLQLLAPLARAVTILTRGEGLSLTEAGFVLRMAPAEVQLRLQAADRELARVMARRVLIVEDDALTAIDLEDLVTSLGHCAIGPAMTRIEAVSLAMQEEPDLILSDVQLDDRNAGIDAIREIRCRMNVPVIFVTAYPGHFADRAILDNSYVVHKPFSDGMISSLITNALRLSPDGS